MSAIAHTTIEFFEDAGPRSCTSWASCASRHSRAMAPIRPAPGASPGRTRQAADSTDRGGHGDVPGSVDDASLHAGGRAITARQPSFATRYVHQPFSYNVLRARPSRRSSSTPILARHLLHSAHPGTRLL